MMDFTPVVQAGSYGMSLKRQSLPPPSKSIFVNASTYILTPRDIIASIDNR